MAKVLTIPIIVRPEDEGRANEVLSGARIVHEGRCLDGARVIVACFKVEDSEITPHAWTPLEGEIRGALDEAGLTYELHGYGLEHVDSWPSNAS